MHHFLLEFITGGGMTGVALPESLRKEGELMLQTLLHELMQAGYTNISITRDARLEFKLKNIKQYLINNTLEKELSDLVKKTDVCWLIAPETGDSLASLAELLVKYGGSHIGCRPDSIRLCASKMATIKVLEDAGIHTIDTCFLSGSTIYSQQGWVVKPDDGVGGEDCLFIKDSTQLAKFKKENRDGNYIVQPYINGEHLSMSLLVYETEMRLLACNRQYINWDNDSAVLKGIGVNECLSVREEFFLLARKIVSIVPSLAGYVGIDLIKSDNTLFVMEINPRLTTAYAGLSKSLGINITEAILNTFLNKKLPDIDLTTAKPIRINV